MAKGLDEPVEAVTGGAALVAEMRVIKLCGYTLDNAAHAGIRCFNLAGITDLSVPARFSNRNCILQLGNIDSDKSFSIICHGSSSCREIGSAYPSNPRKTSVGRATSAKKMDIWTYLTTMPLTRSVCKAISLADFAHVLKFFSAKLCNRQNEAGGVMKMSAHAECEF